MQPRVLRIITRLNVGGPATHVLLANRGLTLRGYRCLLIHGALHRGEAGVQPASFGDVGEVEYVPALQRPIRPFADARAALALTRIVRRFRPDIIHTHMSKAGLLGRAVGMLIGRCRLVHTFHGNHFADFFSPLTTRMVVSVERTLGARTDAVIAISEEQRRELEALRICRPNALEVIELGLDLDRYRGVRSPGARAAARHRLNIDAEATVLVYAGRLVPIKRVDRLIRVTAPLLAGDSRLLLAIVGDGPERLHLEALGRQLGIAARLRFHGWSRAMADWYGAADVVVLASAREGTPLTIIEAMAAGRATVATDVGGVRDIIDHGRTGFVVGKEDEEGLCRALRTLALDPALREQFGRAAAADSQRFDAERLVDQLDSLYQRLLSGAPVAAGVR